MRTQHAKTNTTLQNSHRQTPKRCNMLFQSERSLKCILEGQSTSNTTSLLHKEGQCLLQIENMSMSCRVTVAEKENKLFSTKNSNRHSRLGIKINIHSQ